MRNRSGSLRYFRLGNLVSKRSFRLSVVLLGKELPDREADDFGDYKVVCGTKEAG
jgi:hypothetical protein